MIKKILTLLILCLTVLGTAFPQKAWYKEKQLKLNTYLFSDPNPVPEFGIIYPYFRFDGYAVKGHLQEHRMIILENPYIKLWITPDIGGKIWGALEKSTGKDFIYFNHAVKFRDVAMRGPWTSGGIEFNFGAIGHAPSCSTPVDYFIRKNDDGSVSCFVGALDLPSGTRWSVEINLPADKAYFTTRSMWDNPGDLEQSYYHWTNAGIKAAGNLEYVFPGNHYLGHDGKCFPWPVDKEGRDLHFYDNNNFGSYKSYHVFGEVTNFYGGFWHNDNFGFGHYSLYDEKPGKKVWIWGLSDQGMIWEKLLTDTDGQYTELQSGRLFNQAASESTLSPFKHRAFLPGTTDTWIEYWFPVKGINGLRNGAPQGSVNLTSGNGKIDISYCPNQKINGIIAVKDHAESVFTKSIQLTPLQSFADSFSFHGNTNDLSVWLDNKLIYTVNPQKRIIKRPVEMPANFNWKTAYGYYLKGKEWERQRYYKKAEEDYEKSLHQNQWFVPSLDGMSILCYRKMNYQKAFKYAKMALSVDTYDPFGNLQYALSSLALGDTTSAIDGFSIASESVSLRSVAYNGLATIFLRKMQFGRSLHYANASLAANSLGAEANQLKEIVLRLAGDTAEANVVLEKLNQRDPLNHFIRMEKWLANPSKTNEQNIYKFMTGELPAETFLQYALWYYDKGLHADALKIMGMAPEKPIVLIWKAYLNHLCGNEDESKVILSKALATSPNLVFPSRPETMNALHWAEKQGENWKIKWYKALICLNAGAVTEGTQLITECHNVPDFYPFYLLRASLWDKSSEMADKDVQEALKIGGNQWRVGLFASRFYLERGDTIRSLQYATDFLRKNRDNYYLGLQLAKVLELHGDYAQCV